ncbi:Major facilitator superfamily domain, general substrate transporter [Cordyceps fumosorosea ARSEF 2679]|uniref:Major facilitator superfamily domain, general substrate transporter n=1 Tax=Cordyceps fumosorosea (strain ARSEF 2679) TaxID=1081104 RepID=A0A168EHI3_CORFA|nr:Major facilitator superfamily domain, general substrate transporter [Cordyceps fumosorosea ARSEF 2679]OAA73811.1 Major facilitator superfamily domain, general substrate transporter [Cordyceps fumosorosea ARSEF 2679]
MAFAETEPLLQQHIPQHHHASPTTRHHSGSPASTTTTNTTTTTGAAFRAAGVARMDAVTARLTSTQRFWLFFGIFVVGYAYGLESQVRSTYAPYATASFNLHSYLATINVLRSVVAVAAQPTAAKVADVFGRFEVVVASTLFYVVGMAIEATASSVYVYCAGGLIYQVGYTCIVLLLEVLVADFSSMRARVFFSYVPALPFVINTWLSGTVTSAVLRVATWRWGIGMWCIIYPIASLPLLVTLYVVDRSVAASPKALLESHKQQSSSKLQEARHRVQEARRWVHNVSTQLDLFGLVVLVACFSLVLAPLTVAGGTASHWQNPRIILSLVVGCICAPVFIFWEKYHAKTPIVPLHLLADRGVWAALAVRSLLNFAWYVQGNYLYTILIVAFDFSVQTATRIISFFSFFGVVSGVLVGLVVYRVRRLKHIIVGGTVTFMMAFVLLISQPGGASSQSRTGIISAQILLGLAGGLFAYPTQASIQASASRDHVAILTGLYLSFYNVGSALGTCLSGAIWTQTLYPALESSLAFQPNRTLAQAMYNNPFEVVKNYPVGTEIRGAIIGSYSYVQGLLCIAGLCVCMPMIGFALALRNPRLSDKQVQDEAERDPYEA